MIRENLQEAVRAAMILGVDNSDVATWNNTLAHLAPYKVGRYGQLQEWSKDIDDPNDHHRHVNHLFGLHPGTTISPITTPALAEARAWYSTTAATEPPVGRWDGNSTNGRACTTATGATSSLLIC